MDGLMLPWNTSLTNINVRVNDRLATEVDAFGLFFTWIAKTATAITRARGGQGDRGQVEIWIESAAPGKTAQAFGAAAVRRGNTVFVRYALATFSAEELDKEDGQELAPLIVGPWARGLEFSPSEKSNGSFSRTIEDAGAMEAMHAWILEAECPEFEAIRAETRMRTILDRGDAPVAPGPRGGL